jgi:hypothetical protein
MTVLHPAADFGHRVAGQNAHQHGTCRLGAAGAVNEQAPSPDGEVEQGDQYEAAVGLADGKVDLGLRVAEPEALVGAVEVLDVVVGADVGLVDDSEIRLTQLLIPGDLVGMFFAREIGPR